MFVAAGIIQVPEGLSHQVFCDRIVVLLFGTQKEFVFVLHNIASIYLWIYVLESYLTNGSRIRMEAILPKVHA